MELRNLLGKRIERSVLQLSIVLLCVSFLFSSLIYFRKASSFYRLNLPALEEAVGKVEKLRSFVAKAETLRFKDGDHISFARSLDAIRSTLKDPQITLSEPKITENLRSVNLSIKGDGRFGEIIQVLRLLEEEKSPIFLLKLLSIKKKEGAVLTYEISTEVFFTR